MQVLGFRLTVEVPLLASGFEVASFSHLLKYLAQFHLAFGVPETSVGTSLASKHHFQKHWGQHHSEFFK
jgi:hypothetical protein